MYETIHISIPQHKRRYGNTGRARGQVIAQQAQVQRVTQSKHAHCCACVYHCNVHRLNKFEQDILTIHPNINASEASLSLHTFCVHAGLASERIDRH